MRLLLRNHRSRPRLIINQSPLPKSHANLQISRVLELVLMVQLLLRILNVLYNALQLFDYPPTFKIGFLVVPLAVDQSVHAVITHGFDLLEVSFQFFVRLAWDVYRDLAMQDEVKLVSNRAGLEQDCSLLELLVTRSPNNIKHCPVIVIPLLKKHRIAKVRQQTDHLILLSEILRLPQHFNLLSDVCRDHTHLFYLFCQF